MYAEFPESLLFVKLSETLLSALIIPVTYPDYCIPTDRKNKILSSTSSNKY